MTAPQKRITLTINIGPLEPLWFIPFRVLATCVTIFGPITFTSLVLDSTAADILAALFGALGILVLAAAVSDHTGHKRKRFDNAEAAAEWVRQWPENMP